MSDQPSTAANPYREPTDRERERKRVIEGRIKTAFGRFVGDEQALDIAGWVTAGYPWARTEEASQPAALVTIEVRHDDIDGGYVASSVDALGCMSQGETIAEAIENFADAYTSWLEAQRVR